MLQTTGRFGQTRFHIISGHRQAFDLGYGPFDIPIIPPGAPLSPQTTIKPDQCGKAPGILTMAGWCGFDWVNTVTTEADAALYDEHGAGGGFRTGQGLLVFDADITNRRLARKVRAVVRKFMGGKLPPTRIGQWSKASFFFRINGQMNSGLITFDSGKIELSGIGKQSVAFGIHPITGKPFWWPVPLCPYDELPLLTWDQVIALTLLLKDALPNAKVSMPGLGGDADQADESKVWSNPERVRYAVSLIPNTSEHFPTRASCIAFGYACKAALGEDGLEAYQEWAARWTGGTNDPQWVEGQFKSFHGPYRAGASWLYELAEKLGPPGMLNKGDALGKDIVDRFFPEMNAQREFVEEFDRDMADIRAAEARAEEQRRAEEQNKADPNAKQEQPIGGLKLFRASELVGEPPARVFLDARGFFVACKVVILSGAGGVGKTLVAIQLSVSVATGTQFLGADVLKGPVLFYSGEEDREEFHRRLRDITRLQGLSAADLDDFLIYDASSEDAAILVTSPDDRSKLIYTPKFNELEESIKFNRPQLVVLDNRGQLVRANEIDRNVASQAVNLLQRLAMKYRTTIVFLQHPSQSGLKDGTGQSGSTGWTNTARGHVDMIDPYAKEQDLDSGQRVLINRKANYAQRGTSIDVVWMHGAYAIAQPGDPEIISRDGIHFLDLLVKFTHEKIRVSNNPHSINYAPRVFLRNKIGRQLGEKRLAEAMASLFDRKLIAVVEYGRPSRPNSRLEITLPEGDE